VVVVHEVGNESEDDSEDDERRYQLFVEKLVAVVGPPVVSGHR